MDGMGDKHLGGPRFKVRNGHIKRLTDSDIQSSVLETSADFGTKILGWPK